MFINSRNDSACPVYCTKAILVVSCLLLFVLNCTKNTASVSETNTGQIAGWVVDENKKGIKGADVILRSAQTFKFIAAAPKFIAKTVQDDTIEPDSTRTSSSGYFVFESVAEGDYYLEINNHDSTGAIVGASVKDDTVEQESDTITVKPFGAISGSLSETITESKSSYIYIVELDRRVPLDSLGRFLVTNVPARDYRIRLIENGTIVESLLDTVIITVEERDTTETFNIGSAAGSITIDGTIQE